MEFGKFQVRIDRTEAQRLAAMPQEMFWIEVQESGLGQTFLVQPMKWSAHGWTPDGEPVNITNFDNW